MMFVCWSLSAQHVFSERDIAAHRESQDNDFATEGRSPLTDQDRKHFRGLDYFAADKNCFVEAEFTRTPQEKSFEMKTSTDRRPIYRKYGELHFTLHGRKLKLNVYQNLDLIIKPGFGDYLFLPFSDATNGNETYVGGRYIDLKIPVGDKIYIDFNI